MTWDQLDAIADSVNPTLGIVALLWPWVFWRDSFRRAVLSVVATLLSVAFAYAASALDTHFGWWPAMGLDFSTHTAISVSLIVSLCSIKPSLWIAWTGVLLGYFVLMVYQGYHTVSDIVTTTAVTAPPVILWRWWVRKASGSSHTGQSF